MDADGEVSTLVCALRLEVFTESRESSSLRFLFFFLGNHNYGETQEGNVGRGGYADGEKVNTATRPKMMSWQFRTAVLYPWFHRSGRFHECGWVLPTPTWEGGGHGPPPTPSEVAHRPPQSKGLATSHPQWWCPPPLGWLARHPWPMGVATHGLGVAWSHPLPQGGGCQTLHFQFFFLKIKTKI